MVVKSCLRAPADMERRIDVFLAPLHDLRDFVPIRDILELHVFDRRTRDDHAVVFFMADIVKRAVERRQIILRRMRRDIRARINEVNLDLQRRIAEQTQKLRLRNRLDRHQVQNQNMKRTDILLIRTIRIHNENIFTL